MHIKFIDTGKGSASSAQSYLLREHDHKGEIRESVQVLRGNPDQVTAVAESLEFKHTYRSAVIAWHKDDHPTPKQIQEVLDEFERVAFAGLEPNQYTYYAVWHGERNGSGHIHIVTPRVELQTGKSLNIAPPGWQSTYDLIRDKFNAKYQWASPKDLHRRQTLTLDKTMIHSDLPSAKAKKLLNGGVNQAIKDGLIKDHADVKSYLAHFGEITRTGKDYISVKPKGFKKAIRLKGAVYEREFSIERFNRELEAEQRARVSDNQADREREVRRIERSIERTVEQRAIYHRSRYDYKAIRLQREANQSPIRDRQAGERTTQRDPSTAQEDPKRDRGDREETLPDRPKKVDHTNRDRDLNRGRIGDRFMEFGQVRNAPTPSDSGQQRGVDAAGGTDSRSEDDLRQVHQESVEQRYRGEEEARGLVGQIGHGALDRAIREKQRELNDRIRERITSHCKVARKAVLRGIEEHQDPIRERVERHERRLSRAYEESYALNRRADDHYQEAERHDRKTEQVIEQVRERVGRNKDNFGSRAIESLRESAQRFAQSFGRIGEVRQKFGRSVERCIGRAVEKVQEIKAERRKQQQRSRSSGMSMRR